MPAVPSRSLGRLRQDTPGYRWVVLSNTTLGMLIATVNSSIVIISLPAIFRGIGLHPLAPGNVSYLLWMFMGYLLVTAALVVSVGKLGDLYGRTRIYSLGFAVFTVAAIALTLDPASGAAGALWLIGWRVVQGVGAAMVLANSTAILTDVFPPARRGTAIGINQVAAIAGSFLGLLAGGLLSEVGWRLVFFVSAPLGILGTVWSYASLREVGRGPGPADRRIDWWGNTLLAAGLLAILAAITYGIQPYRGHTMGWTNPAPRVRRQQPGRLARLDRPRRPAARPGHLAAGHLAAAARLHLRAGALSRLPPADANTLTGTRFFPTLIAGPFHTGLVIAFVAAIALTVVAAAASLAGGRRYVHDDDAAASDGGPRPAASQDTGTGRGTGLASARVRVRAL